MCSIAGTSEWDCLGNNPKPHKLEHPQSQVNVYNNVIHNVIALVSQAELRAIVSMHAGLRVGTEEEDQARHEPSDLRTRLQYSGL